MGKNMGQSEQTYIQPTLKLKNHVERTNFHIVVYQNRMFHVHLFASFANFPQKNTFISTIYPSRSSIKVIKVRPQQLPQGRWWIIRTFVDLAHHSQL